MFQSSTLQFNQWQGYSVEGKNDSQWLDYSAEGGHENEKTNLWRSSTSGKYSPDVFHPEFNDCPSGKEAMQVTKVSKKKTILKKCTMYLYIVLFLAALLVPLILTNTKQGVVSEIDNRVLKEFPKFGEENFEEDVESYLKDRIGLRNVMVTSYQLFNDKVTGELTHPIYIYGKNGYTFYAMHPNITLDPFLKSFARAVQKMQQYCEERGVKFYFEFDPEKTSVYRRYLPAGVNYSDAWVDELMDYMKSLGINCICNRDLLMERSETEQVFNQKYDAGHWNDLGCFYGTNHLWATMHEDFPEVTEYSLDEFDITTTIGEYLASSQFPVHEEVPVFQLKNGWEDHSDLYSGLKLHNNYRYFFDYVNQAEDASALPKLLVFQGSYYNRKPEFFEGRASEYVGIHNYQNVFNLDYYFNIFQPDAVVFENAEYTFTDGYYDRNLARKLHFNPGLGKNWQEVEEILSKAKHVSADEIALTGVNQLDESQPDEGASSDSLKLNVIPGTGYDTVYMNQESPSVRYAYLIAGEQVFDLQQKVVNVLSACVPHEAITDQAIFYYEDNDGNTYCLDLEPQAPQRAIENITYSDGARYDEENQAYVMETELDDNSFNSVCIQLIDAETEAFVEIITAAGELGQVRGTYTLEGNDGWYKIRLKANSTLYDEFLEFPTYLEKGKQYSYAFDLETLDPQRVVIKNYEFYENGAGSEGEE